MINIPVEDKDIQTIIRAFHIAIDSQEQNSIRRQEFADLYKRIYYSIELSDDPENDEDF